MLVIKQFGPVTYAMGTLQEILAGTGIAAKVRALPNDVAGCTLQHDGSKWYGHLGVLTSEYAKTLPTDKLARYSWTQLETGEIVSIPYFGRLHLDAGSFPGTDSTTPTFSNSVSDAQYTSFGTAPIANGIMYPVGSSGDSAIHVTPTVTRTYKSGTYSQGIIPLYDNINNSMVGMNPRFSFFIPAGQFAILYKAGKTSHSFNIRINANQYTYTATGLTPGLAYNLNVTMGAADNYVQFDSSAPGIGGIWVANGSTPSPYRQKLLFCCIGDSISGGATLYDSQSSWFGLLCREFGADGLNLSIGSSGWFTTGSYGTSVFRDRVNQAASAFPDIQFWFGAINDGSLPDGDLCTEVKHCIHLFRSISPKTKHVVLGRWPGQSYGGSAIISSHNSELLAAANDSGAMFVDFLTAFPQTSERTTAYSGVGDQYVDMNGIGYIRGLSSGIPTAMINADNMSAIVNISDGPHPTIVGCNAIKSRVRAFLG